MAPRRDPVPYQNNPKDSLTLSLSKLTGKVVKDVEGYYSTETGFTIHRILFDDDTYMFVDGVYDAAYVWAHTGGPQFLIDLEDLYDYEED